MDPGSTFSIYENRKGKNCIRAFHSLHYTIFQSIICLESNSQTIFWLILCAILCLFHDIHECHNFLWTLHGIRVIINYHMTYYFSTIFVGWPGVMKIVSQVKETNFSELITTATSKIRLST